MNLTGMSESSSSSFYDIFPLISMGGNFKDQNSETFYFPLHKHTNAPNAKHGSLFSVVLRFSIMVHFRHISLRRFMIKFSN